MKHYVLFELPKDAISDLFPGFFKLSEDVFNIIIYAYVALFKILYLLFVLIPYVALAISSA